MWLLRIRTSYNLMIMQFRDNGMCDWGTPEKNDRLNTTKSLNIQSSNNKTPSPESVQIPGQNLRFVFPTSNIVLGKDYNDYFEFHNMNVWLWNPWKNDTHCLKIQDFSTGYYYRYLLIDKTLLIHKNLYLFSYLCQERLLSVHSYTQEMNLSSDHLFF